jgi:hypothetical protein
MLTGVAAGVMELVYGSGSIMDRFGTYSSREQECICCGQGSCIFKVERV